MTVGGAKETTMITLVRAMALAATACTAAAVVIALRMPEQGGPAVPLVAAPAASQTTSPGPGSGLSGGPGLGAGAAGLAEGRFVAGTVPSGPGGSAPPAPPHAAGTASGPRSGRPPTGSDGVCT
jgi:hypothetical protein